MNKYEGNFGEKIEKEETEILENRFELMTGKSI